MTIPNAGIHPLSGFIGANMIPKWAEDLVKKHCPHITLNWTPTAKPHSEGWATLEPDTIIIHAGTNQWEQKYVLIHEIAHINSKSLRHNNEFFQQLDFLLKTYNVNRQKACQREGVYPEWFKD